MSDSSFNPVSGPSRHSHASCGRVLAALLMLSCLIQNPAADAHERGAQLAPAANLRQAMRKLWEDHVTWTRLLIVSTAADLPDREATAQRLLQNQQDIGDAVKGFYGDAAGAKLTELLRAHILGAGEVLASARSGDAGRLAAAKKAWYQNADDISAFLSTANPHAWPMAEMQPMMREHLDLTLAEAVDQLQGRYAQSVADYDRVHDAILSMADMLTDGIVAQFPKKF